MSQQDAAPPSAGAIAVLVEQAARAAVALHAGPGYRMAITRLLVVYLAEAVEPLTAEGTVVRHGRTVGVADVWVRGPSGTPVAKGVITYRMTAPAQP